MAKRGGKKLRKSGDEVQETMASVLDELIAFEDFRSTILPKLKEMIAAGKSADEMYSWAESYAAGRAISIALTESDSTKALSGVKEILDRSKGKAKERVDVEHRYSKLKDEEIDALLESKLAEATLADDDSKQH
jgi:hypothetical protein